MLTATNMPAAPTTNLEAEAVDAIVKLCSEYEPFEFSGGGCPCLRKGLLEIVQKITRKDGGSDGSPQ